MNALDLYRSNAAEARDAALASVLGNSREAWKDEVFRHIKALPPGEYIGEDIRLSCESAGLKPHHPNAWGAMIRAVILKGILTQTGRMRAMSTTRSHARRSEILEKK